MRVVRAAEFVIVVQVREFEGPQDYPYDWAASTGEESATLFLTAEEAMEDARVHFS